MPRIEAEKINAEHRSSPIDDGTETTAGTQKKTTEKEEFGRKKSGRRLGFGRKKSGRGLKNGEAEKENCMK